MIGPMRGHEGRAPRDEPRARNMRVSDENRSRMSSYRSETATFLPGTCHSQNDGHLVVGRTVSRMCLWDFRPTSCNAITQHDWCRRSTNARSPRARWPTSKFSTSCTAAFPVLLRHSFAERTQFGGRPISACGIYTTAPISQRNVRYEHILSTPRRFLLMKSDMQIRRLGHLLAAELRASKMSYDRPCAEASTSAHKTPITREPCGSHVRGLTTCIPHLRLMAAASHERRRRPRCHEENHPPSRQRRTGLLS